MNFLRNKEVRTECLIGISITVIATCGAFLWNPLFGGFMGVVCLIFDLLHCTYIYKRYQKIQMLAADIDNILHGEIAISFEKYEEGELAVLESEVQKMMIRLREQQQHLLDDKKYLADSIADISHQIRTPFLYIK